jgi:hypothetical protein
MMVRHCPLAPTLLPIPSANHYRGSHRNLRATVAQTAFMGFSGCRRKQKIWGGLDRWSAITRPWQDNPWTSRCAFAAAIRRPTNKQVGSLEASSFRVEGCTGHSRGNRQPDYACNSNSNYCGKKLPRLRETCSHSDPPPACRLVYYFVTSPLEPFPPGARNVRLFVSRLRGRAVRRTSHDSLSLGRFRFWKIS